MDAVIVTSTAEQEDVYKKYRCHCWSIEIMQPFRVSQGGVKRRRNPEEMATGELPLPPFPADTPGNPQYLVNLIRLNDESLRDTLFWSMFRGAILFDDMRTAMAYKKEQQRLNRPVDGLYTRDGVKIPHGGNTNPRSGLPAWKASHDKGDKYSFGVAAAGVDQGTLRRLERDLNDCEVVLKPLLETTRTLRDKVTRAREAAAKSEDRKRYKQLCDGLAELGVVMTQPEGMIPKASADYGEGDDDDDDDDDDGGGGGDEEEGGDGVGGGAASIEEGGNDERKRGEPEGAARGKRSRSAMGEDDGTERTVELEEGARKRRPRRSEAPDEDGRGGHKRGSPPAGDPRANRPGSRRRTG